MYAIVFQIVWVIFSVLKKVFLYVASQVFEVVKIFVETRIGIIALVPFVITSYHILATANENGGRPYSVSIYIMVLVFILLASFRVLMDGFLVSALLIECLRGAKVNLSQVINLGLTGIELIDVILPIMLIIILAAYILQRFKISYWVIGFTGCVLYATMIFTVSKGMFDMFWNTFHFISVLLLTLMGHWFRYIATDFWSERFKNKNIIPGGEQ